MIEHAVTIVPMITVAQAYCIVIEFCLTIPGIVNVVTLLLLSGRPGLASGVCLRNTRELILPQCIVTGLVRVPRDLIALTRQQSVGTLSRAVPLLLLPQLICGLHY